MEIKFEKKQEDTQFVVIDGHYIPASMVKNVVTFWMFAAFVILAYIFAQIDAQNNVLQTAYLCSGGVINITSNNTMHCVPTLDKKVIKWDCTEVSKNATNPA